MEVNDKNGFGSVQNVNNTPQSSNLIERYKAQQALQNSEPPKDTIQLTRDFIADLDYDKEKAAFGTILKGHINNKNAIFKLASNNDECWYEGAINKKYLLLHTNGKSYDGKYGDKEFNLNVDFNKPSKFTEFFKGKLLGKTFRPDYFTVQGTLGDKTINITLPNVKIPEDSETRDILTMLLEDNGLKAQTINGEIKSLRFAYSAVKNIKEKAEKREQMINNDIKPIFMNGISTASGMVVGAIVSAILLKFGIKQH